MPLTDASQVISTSRLSWYYLIQKTVCYTEAGLFPSISDFTVMSIARFSATAEVIWRGEERSVREPINWFELSEGLWPHEQSVCAAFTSDSSCGSSLPPAMPWESARQASGIGEKKTQQGAICLLLQTHWYAPQWIQTTHGRTNEIKVVACYLSTEVTEKDSSKCVHKASIIHDMASAVILLGI